MAQQLTTEQVLLLNNLMYMKDDGVLASIVNAENQTVKDVITNINVEQLEPNKDYGSYITGSDWKDIINTIKQDEQLCNMKIVSTNVDNTPDGGGGASAVFVDPTTKEAVVTFRGTADKEWKDNFTGGGPTDGLDQVSTIHQENALEWYRSLDLEDYSTITVTGHSKGGNKAKYLTVMDDSIDRCLAFDGQGFSDEFIKEYSDQIAANQGKITNHNVDSDYVNLLLNDIGNTVFYKGYDYGEGKFLENHCPNTFFKFNEDGTVSMALSTRDERMAEVDEFLNNYLRTLAPEDKKTTLEMIGQLVEGGFNKASAEQLIKVLVSNENVDHAGHLLAYMLKYEDANPGLTDSLSSILKDMEMDELSFIVWLANTNESFKDTNLLNKLRGDLNFWELMKVGGFALNHLPQFAVDWLRNLLEEKGIHLSDAQLRKLLGLMKVVADDLPGIHIEDNGKDLTVNKSSLDAKSMKPCDFNVQLATLNDSKNNLDDIYLKMVEIEESVKNITTQIHWGTAFMQYKVALLGLQSQIEKEVLACKHMKQAMGTIYYHYKNTEEKVINQTQG